MNSQFRYNNFTVWRNYWHVDQAYTAICTFTHDPYNKCPLRLIISDQVYLKELLTCMLMEDYLLSLVLRLSIRLYYLKRNRLYYLLFSMNY